ncbi:MAG: hemerythrin domain-containing protein [Deltaproteobacteria bacterium]|nr:hemerythrin domain-containing protein [Deltaproteobacteria bacterium]
MLLQIGRNKGADARPPDALDELAACHARIRSFTQLAARLADGSDASPQALAEAAASVARYYAVALPKHAEDEDRSLAPALRSATLPDDVLAAIDVMRVEHDELDAIVAAAMPAWNALASDPSSWPDHAGLLRECARTLGLFWDRHLGLEERVIFPAARKLLDTTALEKLGREMRARRQPTVGIAQTTRGG